MDTDKIKRYYNSSKKYFKFIGIIILIYILNKIDWHRLQISLKNVNFTLFFISFFLFFLIILAKAIRLKKIIRLLNQNITLKESYIIYIKSYFWGLITPGRSGDFTKVVYLQSKNISGKKSFFIAAVDKAYDITVLFFLASISCVWVMEIENYKRILLVLLTALIFFFILFFIKNILRRIISVLSVRYEKLNIDMENIDIFFLKNFFSELFTISLVSWMVFYVQTYIGLYSLNLNLNLMDIVVICVGGSLITLVPISFGGLGTREAAIIFMGSNFFNLSFDQITLFLFYNWLVVLSQIIFSFVFWFIL